MKFFLLLALVGLAIAQSCDVENEWSAHIQTSSTFIGGGWEDYEISAWGMDGGNKWQSFWLDSLPDVGTSRYNYATCKAKIDDNNGIDPVNREIPNFASSCGSCPLFVSSSAACSCYPYTDVASNNLPDHDPVLPPFENPIGDGERWTSENCKQNRPQMIYYYSNKASLNDGTYKANLGISKAFTPTGDAWANFCDSLDYANPRNDETCHLPLPTGASEVNALKGAHYVSYQGFYELGNDDDIDLYINQIESGCHMKTMDHRYPSAVYCGDDSGWSYGAGVYGHVRFGCARGTFDTESTDILGIIDDGDCDTVYVGFDEMNPLIDTWGKKDFSPSLPIVFANYLDLCWYDSSFEDFVSNIPSYRTPCEGDPSGAMQLAVPLFTIVSALLMVLRNF